MSNTKGGALIVLAARSSQPGENNAYFIFAFFGRYTAAHTGVPKHATGLV